MAYDSPADELFYGGAAGGGKTDLLLGLAGYAHRKAVIFRRIFPSVRAIIERSRAIYNARGATHGKDSYNESTHIWRLDSGRLVEFGACQFEKNKEDQRGRDRDFYGFDEITEFSESIFRFITAWNRSTYRYPDGTRQRCRVVATGNPPTHPAGEWVIQYWGPWLDSAHPMYPVPAGDLRFVARIADADVWFHPDDVRADKTVLVNGASYTVRSRTFIPARLSDNPYLLNSGYDAIIDSLPEPLRSQMKLGIFAVTHTDSAWQAIPASWIQQAQARWRERVIDQPMTAMGVDVAHGGKDKTVISRLYGDTFASLLVYAGSETKRGQDAAVKVIEALDGAPVVPNIDAIGYGASCADALSAMGVLNTAVNVASSVPPDIKDRSGLFGFANVRAWLYWLLREALDPESGSDLALPDDRELLSDLCAPTYRVHNRAIIIESKDTVSSRLGRSPDKGDAVLLAFAGDRLFVPPIDNYEDDYDGYEISPV